MSDIVILGEAWGKDEEEARAPFVGPSGRLLNVFLSQAGIRREECFLTNVFNFRPVNNDLKTLGKTKAEAIPGYPPLSSGVYIPLTLKHELDRLYDELRTIKPNLILGLGGTAAWALVRKTGIKKLRGAPVASPFGKCLFTWHPAAVLRDWALRPVALADIKKATRERLYPEIRRPRREIWIRPTVEDLWRFYGRYLSNDDEISVDIEDIGRRVTMIGFAPREDVALVVPFFDWEKPSHNYWDTKEEEIEALKFCKQVLSEKRTVVGQNFLYDMHVLWRQLGIPVPYATHDTMLLHHSLFIELEKGLGFLGSIYTDQGSWKEDHKSEIEKTRSK